MCNLMRLVMSFASPSFYILRHYETRRKYRFEMFVNADKGYYVVFCELGRRECLIISCMYI